MLIKDVRIFDGSNVVAEDSVLLDGELIKAVGRDLPPPSDDRVVQGHGHTLLPGFIDAHTHAYPSALEQALIFGVTTELDMFGNPKFIAKIRREASSAAGHARADLLSAGTGATAPGGHPTELPFFSSVPTISEPSDAEAFVDARIAEGSDYIKIVYDDGSTLGDSLPTIAGQTMTALVDAAHARGKLAIVHIGSLSGAREAVACHADGLAHLFVDRHPDGEFGRFVAGHRTFVVPTLTTLEAMCGVASGESLIDHGALAPYLSPYDRWNLRQPSPTGSQIDVSYGAARECVQQLHDAGVRILAGTDAPNPGTAHGVSLHRELELLVDAGLEPHEALSAATWLPAEQFGLTDRGRIAPGLRADLLLVHGDPTTEIEATRNIVGIWKAGSLVDREAYRVLRSRFQRWVFGWIQRLVVGFAYRRRRRSLERLRTES